MDFERGSVSANGLEFAYLAVGEGPLALCLHGFPDTAWTWRHLLPELARAGYRAVAPFTRGYAPTAVPADNRYQSGVLALDACELHQALGGDADAVLVGHDWGALAAYGAACLQPERWRRVVAAAVPPGASMAQAFMSFDQLRRSWYMFFFLADLAEMVVPLNDCEFMVRLWQDWSPGYGCAEDVAHVRAALAEPANMAAAIAYYRESLQVSRQDPSLSAAQAATLQVPPQPTLYLHGAEDGCISVEFARIGAGYLDSEGSRYEILEDVGHFLHLERPDEVNRLMVDFLTP